MRRPTSPDGSPVRVPAAFSVAEVNTASWRLERPVLAPSLCSKCGTCEMFCPLQAIEVASEGPKFDLAYCKGCGICANECPKKAISMEPEGAEGRGFV